MTFLAKISSTMKKIFLPISFIGKLNNFPIPFIFSENFPYASTNTKHFQKKFSYLQLLFADFEPGFSIKFCVEDSKHYQTHSP